MIDNELKLGDRRPMISYFNSDEQGIEILKGKEASISSYILDQEAEEINFHSSKSVKESRGSWVENISGIIEPYEPENKNVLRDIGEYNEEIKEELYQEFLDAKKEADKIDGECPNCKGELLLVECKYSNVVACNSCGFMQRESNYKKLIYASEQSKDKN